MASSSGGALLRVVSPDQLAEKDAEKLRQEVEREQSAGWEDQLAHHIRTQYQAMKNHRASTKLDERLIKALRIYNGEYDPRKLAEIRQFGGSEVYAKVTTAKCRGATALLRDVYAGAEKAWGIDPTPVPGLPDDMMGSLMELVAMEVQSLREAGQDIPEDAVAARVDQLRTAAEQAQRKKAREKAEDAERHMDDVLVEGGFYEALSDFLTDLPIFPFAVLKGPFVRMRTAMEWVNGEATMVSRPRLVWERVSPFDFFWSPGARDIRNADVIERRTLDRAELEGLIGTPGYKAEAIRAVLLEDAANLRQPAGPDVAEAQLTGRESPWTSNSGQMDMLGFHGCIKGQLLLDWGVSADEISMPEKDYFCSAWLVGRYVIKAKVREVPTRRHAYHVASYDPMPGSIAGDGLCDTLSDVQDVCNAALRALVNNMSMASGPQVDVNLDRLAPGENPDEFYPWKRWQTTEAATVQAAAKPAINFYQPMSNAAEYLGIYEKFTMIADEISAIPRYMTGNERVGGAGRTASGLAMMISNSSKVLQNVARNIDENVVRPSLEMTHDVLMLADEEGVFTGDEFVRVLGVTVAAQKETERVRQLEFLQLTGNPIDLQIMGIEGRASVLRDLATTVGLDGERIIPSAEEIRARMMEQSPAAQQEQAALDGGANGPEQQQVRPRNGETNMGMRTNLVGT